MLRELLTEGRDEEVLALFNKLVARNSELERRLAQLLSSGRKSERVSSAQLLLFLNQLTAQGAKDLDEANQKLRDASGIDENKEQEPKTEPQRKQPPVRRPIPANLRRVENPIPVPEDKRPCPRCGAGLHRS